MKQFPHLHRYRAAFQLPACWGRRTVGSAGACLLAADWPRISHWIPDENWEL